MNIETIIADLKKERSRPTKAIAALEGTDLRKTPAAFTTPNSETTTDKKCRQLSAKGRKRLSEMMKKRWAWA